MSAAIQSIPADEIVQIVPGVLNAGGAALMMIGLGMTDSYRVPIGQILSYPSAAAVGSFFGLTSHEYNWASVYFAGFTNGEQLPSALLMTQYPMVNVGAWLQGGNISGLSLTELQAIPSGTLTISIDGTPVTSSLITLATATSFSNAAQLITNALGTTGPTKATATASFGASFTGSGSSTVLTASVVTGIISIGDIISGTGVPTGTTIINQLSGTQGGAGTYTTSVATTSSGASLTTTSIYMAVETNTGTIAAGLQVTGSGVTAGTYVTGTPTTVGDFTVWPTTQTQKVAIELLTLVEPTVTYDGVSGGFLVVSGTTGTTSSIGFASGSIAGSLMLTQPTGATISQGAVAATPAAFMAAVIAQTKNFATFTTLFDPDGGSGNANKQAFAVWNGQQNNQFMYVAWDTDITPTESTAATSSLGYILEEDEVSGTAPIWEPAGGDLYHAAFLMGFVASIDFEELNGRQTAAFRGQSGLVPSVNSATVAQNLKANSYNFVGLYASRSQQFTFLYPGSVTGEFDWIDTYVNQIQLNAALQQAFMEMLTTVGSIPYNPQGYGTLRAWALDPINAALNFGTIRANVTLSAAQANYVNNQAGFAIDQTLSTQGWYLLILPTPPQVRAARGTPPMTLFYMDGESVQQINLASIVVQ